MFQEGTMYVIWSRGDEQLIFPIDTQESKLDRNKRESPIPKIDKDHGMVMVQLLRADKLEIPER